MNLALISCLYEGKTEEIAAEMRSLNSKLATLNTEAKALKTKIAENLRLLVGYI